MQHLANDEQQMGPTNEQQMGSALGAQEGESSRGGGEQRFSRVPVACSPETGCAGTHLRRQLALHVALAHLKSTSNLNILDVSPLASPAHLLRQPALHLPLAHLKSTSNPNTYAHIYALWHHPAHLLSQLALHLSFLHLLPRALPHRAPPHLQSRGTARMQIDFGPGQGDSKDSG